MAEKADDGQNNGSLQTRIGEREGERRGPENGTPNNVLAAETVAEKTACDGTHGRSGEKSEETELGCLDRNAELADKEKREIAVDAGDIEMLGKHQHDQHRHGPPDRLAGQTAALGIHSPGNGPGMGQLPAVPLADPHENDRRNDGRQRKPTNSTLHVRHDDQGRQQRSHGRTAIAANLKDGLRQSLASARSQLRDLRSLGVENRRPEPDDADGSDQHPEIGRNGERTQTDQRKTHADEQGIRPGMTVGISPDERLENGRSQLKHQGNDTYLREQIGRAHV